MERTKAFVRSQSYRTEDVVDYLPNWLEDSRLFSIDEIPLKISGRETRDIPRDFKRSEQVNKVIGYFILNFSSVTEQSSGRFEAAFSLLDLLRRDPLIRMDLAVPILPVTPGTAQGNLREKRNKAGTKITANKHMNLGRNIPVIRHYNGYFRSFTTSCGSHTGWRK